jgi:transposase
MSARTSIDYTRSLVISEDETKVRHESFFCLRTHYTIKEIAELVGLNKSTVQDIKTKIDNYGSPLPHNQTGCSLKINERLKDA